MASNPVYKYKRPREIIETLNIVLISINHCEEILFLHFPWGALPEMPYCRAATGASSNNS